MIFTKSFLYFPPPLQYDNPISFYTYLLSFCLRIFTNFICISLSNKIVILIFVITDYFIPRSVSMEDLMPFTAISFLGYDKK